MPDNNTRFTWVARRRLLIAGVVFLLHLLCSLALFVFTIATPDQGLAYNVFVFVWLFPSSLLIFLGMPWVFILSMPLTSLLWGIAAAFIFVSAKELATTCPRCRYDLRGLNAATKHCPECGTRLSIRFTMQSHTADAPTPSQTPASPEGQQLIEELLGNRDSVGPDQN